MAMDKQMELFEPVVGAFDEGGLMDEGGSVDPESGNDVPVGSTQEEVRDDIPAQLSEGEFVLPADVVRFHGLEKIMALRDEAKAGLAKMEAMGQMGNSEEATIPDGIPFSMDDLEMEDDGVQDFAQGGVVQAQAGTFVSPNLGVYQQPSQVGGYQPQYTPYTPPVMPAGQTMAQQYTPVQQQAVPTITQQAPTFTGFTGSAAPSPGGYDEMKTYVNDAGMEMQIPFKDGSPIYPIPEGYKLKTKAVQTAQTTTTTDTGTKTAQVQDSDDDDPTDPFAGKQTVRLGGEVYTGKSGFVGDGVKTRRTTGEIMNTEQYAVGTTSSATRPTDGIVAGIKDAFTGLTNQDQMTLTNRNGVTVAMSKDLYEEIIGDKFGVDRQKMLDNLFEQQVQVEKELGDEYSKDIDNQKARELAKDLGVEYKGQSTAELMSKAADLAKEAERKAGKAKAAEKAKQAGQKRRTEAEQLASQYGINAAGKSIEEINAEVNKARADAEASAKREREYLSRVGGYSEGDDGGMGGFTVEGPGGTTYTTDSSGTSGAFTGGPTGMEDEYDFKKGGLVKQMKQSGLASKK